MKALPTSVLLSLSGYLICVVSFFTLGFILDNEIFFTISWTLGIGLHLLASVLFFRTKASMLKKVIYLLLPVPLGFVMTFFATIFTFGLIGNFC